MKAFIYKINNNSYANDILVSNDIYDELNLDETRKYTLVVGQFKIPIGINRLPKNINSLHIGKNLYNKLLLSTTSNLNIWRKNNYIFLGPVIGVLEDERLLRDLSNERIIEKIKCYGIANKKANCIVYHFSLKDIDWSNNTAIGYYFDYDKSKINSSRFYLPQVFYSQSQHTRLYDKFKDNQDIHFINSTTSLDKWCTYDFLSRFDNVLRYLPSTTVYTHFNDVISMLHKYNFIFLKSFYGSLGHEVLSIKMVNNKYVINLNSNGLNEYILESIEDLKLFVTSFINDKPFIVQEGIHLFKYEGRSMDLRVVTQKDGTGNWDVTYNAARVAKGLYSITSRHLGGENFKYEEIYNKLKKINPSVVLPTEKEVKDVAIKIATTLEKGFGSLGEVGLDLGIDHRGHIWYIESNACPNKRPEPGRKFSSILDYSMYLSIN